MAKAKNGSRETTKVMTMDFLHKRSEIKERFIKPYLFVEIVKKFWLKTL